MSRQVNQATLGLIKSFEGLKLVVYRDPVKIPTVGYGHVVRPQDGLNVGDTITQEQADAFLVQDLAAACTGVENAVTVEINDNQFGALVSLAYNVGLSNFGKSTLLRKVDASDFVGAAAQFAVWNEAGGKVLAGLTRRRAAERALFETPVSE